MAYCINSINNQLVSFTVVVQNIKNLEKQRPYCCIVTMEFVKKMLIDVFFFN